MLNKLLIGVVGVLILILSLQKCTINNQNTQLDQKSNLLEVLQDSVRYSKDELNREVASKKVILSTVKELQKENGVLTSNQKKLLAEVRNQPKKDDVKAGVQIEETVTVDSIEYLNSKTVILSETKKGIEVKIINSNPLFKTNDVDAIVVPVKKKWYNRKGFKILLFVAGVATGVSIAR